MRRGFCLQTFSALRPARRPPPWVHRRASSQRGSVYLLLLFGVVLLGAGLAALGPHWQQAAQREREAELQFRGEAIARAIARYRTVTAAAGNPNPPDLQALLWDERVNPPQRHLRRVYADPFSRQADWVLLPAAGGGIRGVHSRSHQLLLREVDAAQSPEPPAGLPRRVSDWHFTAEAAGPL